MNKKTFIKFIKFLTIFISFFVYSELLLIPLDLLGIYETMALTPYLIYSFAGDLLYLAILVFIFRDELTIKFKELIKKRKTFLDIGIKAWFIGLIIMTFTNALITYVFKMGLPDNEEAVRSLIDIAPLYIIFSAVIFAPFIEELMFRKILYNLTIKPIDNFIKLPNTFKLILFISLSGFAFGFMHVIYNYESISDLLFIIPYGSLGGAFAYCYYKTKNIGLTIFLHSMHNLIMVSIQLLVRTFGGDI